MKNLLSAARRRIARFLRTYLSESLDFRARIFNTLALVGIVMGIVFAISTMVTRAGALNTALNLMAAALGVVLLIFANKTNRFQLCYLITIVAVFFLMFPMMFFTAGGYRSGMPSFFVFAVVFTVLMLQGLARKIVTALEILLYFALCLTAYFFPETVTSFETADAEAIDIIIGFVAASVGLTAVINQHIVVYDRKQEQLEHLGQAKTELIGNISHELKTPLTIVSINVQTAADMLTSEPHNDRPRELLANAQSEIIRLSRDRKSTRLNSSH